MASSTADKKNNSITVASKKRAINVALVGNPNVGKSVIFHNLTGVYVDVSNYPGTTIEISQAKLKLEDENKSRDLLVIDTPGVYGISSFNDEEKATRDLVLSADIVINVVSALSLSRDLFLTKQLCDMGKPMLLVINQCDEAKKRKLSINAKKLSKDLGIPIIETIATKAKGLDELKQRILDSVNSSSEEREDQDLIRAGTSSPAIQDMLNPFLNQVLSKAEALMIIEGDEITASRNEVTLPENYIRLREKIYKLRRQEVNKLINKYVSKKSSSKRDMLGSLLLNPVIGSITALAVLYFFLYQFLGIFVAGTVVGFFEESIMQQYYEPAVRFLVTKLMPINTGSGELGNLLFTNPLEAMGTFLAGNYGVLTLTVTYLYGLLLPLVFGFYFGLALLEDSGYLPRLAVLADGVLSKLGMNGRAIVPLILGGGCVTMATVTTRLLNSDKEKIITMALLGLTIPCSAQLGVIQGLLSNIGGISPWLIWGLTLTVIFGLTGLVLNKLVPGTCGNFISDIPPLRLPRLENIWKKTYTRTKIFMDEATPAFFIAAALVAGLQITGLLQYIINATEPIISNILLLPKEAALSFILGIVRRDFGAFGLMDLEMSAAQLVTACIVLTLFVPCIATVAVMVKEKNFKTALAIWFSSWILAFGFGGILARVLAVFM